MTSHANLYVPCSIDQKKKSAFLYERNVRLAIIPYKGCKLYRLDKRTEQEMYLTFFFQQFNQIQSEMLKPVIT